MGESVPIVLLLLLVARWFLVVGPGVTKLGEAEPTDMRFVALLGGIVNLELALACYLTAVPL